MRSQTMKSLSSFRLQDFFYGVHGVKKDIHAGLRWATLAADAGDRPDASGSRDAIFPQTVYCGVLSEDKKAGSDMLWPRSWSLSGICPPAPRPQALAALCVCPPCPRQCLQTLSALCPLWLPLQTRPPCVGQAMCPPRLVSALCRLWPAPPSIVPAMLPSVSAMCPLLVFSLSSRCPLVVRSLSALCRFLAGSMWLWPRLCQLCVRSLVFAPLSVLCPCCLP